MSVSEFPRHQIFQWLEAEMGPEKASIMMDLLPPVGWGDIVTMSDLRAEMAELRGGLSELRGELKADLAANTRTIFFSMLVSNATLVGLVFAAAKLAT